MPDDKSSLASKPIVIHWFEYGKQKDYKVYICKVPGMAPICFVQIHRDWFDEVKVDPKTQEISLPGDAAWNLQGLPEGYLVMGMKGVISLWKKK